MLATLRAHPQIWMTVKQSTKMRAEILWDYENSMPISDGGEAGAIKVPRKQGPEQKGTLAEVLSAALRAKDLKKH